MVTAQRLGRSRPEFGVASPARLSGDRSAEFMRHPYSTIGLIIAFAAVCLAAFETMNASPESRSKSERTGWHIRFSKHTLSLTSQKEEPASQPATTVRIVYTALGLLAIGLGVFSWTRKEHGRIAGGAAALGLIAVAWQWVLIGVCVAIAVFILACLST